MREAITTLLVKRPRKNTPSSSDKNNGARHPPLHTENLLGSPPFSNYIFRKVKSIGK